MNFTSQDAETGMGVKKMCDIINLIINNGNFQGGGFFYGILLTVIDLKLIYNND